MKAKIVTQGLQVSAEVQSYVTRRLNFALNRTHDLVRAIVIRLADINGPRGGIDKTCSVQLSIHGQAPVIVTEKGERIEHAIDRALDRAAHALARRLGRSRHHARSDKRASAFALNSELLPQSV